MNLVELIKNLQRDQYLRQGGSNYQGVLEPPLLSLVGGDDINVREERMGRTKKKMC